MPVATLVLNLVYDSAAVPVTLSIQMLNILIFIFEFQSQSGSNIDLTSESDDQVISFTVQKFYGDIVSSDSVLLYQHDD